LRRAITVGAKDYLIKPYTSEQFVAMIKPIVEQLRTRRSRVQQRVQVREERDTYLVELATSYIKARRTDDTALQVFERLAADPHCETRWLRHLAIIYVLREQWGKLRQLAERLEQR
jgi:YesN/AraC family two-component response regulator